MNNDAKYKKGVTVALLENINNRGYRQKLTIKVGNKCIPKKFLNSAFSLLVFFKSIYLKSSCSKPLQLIIQFLVSLAAQKIIEKRTSKSSVIKLSDLTAQ